jgi:hypothetical protein
MDKRQQQRIKVLTGYSQSEAVRKGLYTAKA